MSNKAISLGIEPTEKESFSFTREEDGVKKTVRGEEVENGWIVTIEKSWEEKNPANDTSDWKYNEFKYISKHDPRLNLKDESDDSIKQTEVKHMLGSVLNTPGTLIVD